jgi:hypothetical protein
VPKVEKSGALTYRIPKVLLRPVAGKLPFTFTMITQTFVCLTLCNVKYRYFDELLYKRNRRNKVSKRKELTELGKQKTKKRERRQRDRSKTNGKRKRHRKGKQETKETRIGKVDEIRKKRIG